MNKIRPSKNTNTTRKQLCLISTLALTILILIFLTVAVLSISKLNSQIKLTTEHPFVVSRYVGEVRADVAQMRIRTERLQSYNQPKDVLRVEAALTELYSEISLPLTEIQRLYLGPAKDADLIVNTFNEIHDLQQKLLDFAAVPGTTKEEIIAYEEEHLYPLYDRIEEGSLVILAFTQNTQMTVYQSAKSLWKATIIWSVLIGFSTISGLILFQYVLGKMDKEIYYKNQQFDILSHTIDETFLIFEGSSTVCDLVAENSIRVLGIPSEELKQNRKLLYDYVDDETGAEVKEKLYGDIANLPCEMSIPFCHPKTQESRWLFARFYRTGSGDNTKHVLTLSDQTEDIQARQALQDALSNAQNANNTKRDFLSRMSHEIRTPMNAIIGMTTIAGASIEDRNRVEDCLSKISYSSKHLLMLINDVLDMSRIESNKLSLNNEPFDLYQFINSFVSIIYSQAQCKNIVFTEKIIGFTENTTYVGDVLRLNQILLNLTSNAIKFTGDGGNVTLEVKRIPSHDGNERIRFTVSDTGIGMSESELKHLYDPFEQANASISQKYGGTGLGMSIAKNLVSLMCGYINVKSQPNVGTECRVELPFTKSNIELDVLPPEDLKSLNVLVVDDERDMCEHTMLLLSKINIRSKWVLSGEEAVELVVAARDSGDGFDICFVDWNMPDVDGVETTRRIRARVGSETPIIIISAYDWSDIEQEARKAGANAFISKPLFLSSIYNVLVNVTNGAFARSVAQGASEHLALKGKIILVVEDNELNLEIAEEMLKMNGATVDCAHNGLEAANCFANSEPGHFDAILMDIQMPVMNGYEATQRIRELLRDDAQKIPIIATTANAFTEDMSAALASGMNAHISKPIDMHKLCQILSQFIE